MVDKYRDFASNLLQSKIICPTQMIYKRARKHVLWRKENREELFVSRMIIRTSVVALILALVSVIAMPSPGTKQTGMVELVLRVQHNIVLLLESTKIQQGNLHFKI